MDTDVGGKEGRHEVVGRWLHHFSREGVEDGAVAGRKGFVGGVNGGADGGVVEVGGVGGWIGGVCAVVGDVVGAEAGACAVEVV